MAHSLYLRFADRPGPDLVACNRADQVELERRTQGTFATNRAAMSGHDNLVNRPSNATPLADI